MQKIHLDKYTKEQAIEYADLEGEMNGFDRNDSRWKKAFKEYITHAVGTMSVGRNPRSHRYKTITELYPEMFGKNGFAGQVAEKMSGTSLEQKFKGAQFRILSSVMNLVKMYEAGILNIKNTTVGDDQGKISNDKMSELQFPNKEEFGSKDEYETALRDVVFNWFLRDLITDCVLESLNIFVRLTAKDVEEIMGAINIEQASLKELVGQGRVEFIKRLRAQVLPRIQQINYKKLVLG